MKYVVVTFTAASLAKVLKRSASRCVCVFAALDSAAKVMRCIQYSLVVVVLVEILERIVG